GNVTDADGPEIGQSGLRAHRGELGTVDFDLVRPSRTRVRECLDRRGGHAGPPRGSARVSVALWAGFPRKVAGCSLTRDHPRARIRRILASFAVDRPRARSRIPRASVGAQ